MTAHFWSSSKQKRELIRPRLQCAILSRRGAVVTVIAFAFILLFQGAPAARPGVVTGQIRTIENAPAFAVRVAAYPVPTGTAIPTDGQEYFTFQPATSTALTDSQGRYRLANVPPG